jgi:hypothetical protein
VNGVADIVEQLEPLEALLQVSEFVHDGGEVKRSLGRANSGMSRGEKTGRNTKFQTPNFK